MLESEKKTSFMNPFTTGLVSVTFRALSPSQIIELAGEAGLAGIEWGGDVHVPPTDRQAAAKVRDATLQAGLAVISYGSYYRAGHSEPAAFEQVLQTALEIGAPTIRVWAGRQGSADCSPATRHQVVDDLKRIVDVAAARDIVIACEYHGGTLTDTIDSTRLLMNETAATGLRTYWQPLPGTSLDQRTRGLQEVIPVLRHLHVFNWHIDTNERLPLAENSEGWRHWLQLIAQAPDCPSHQIACLLEFVRDDQPTNFKADAQALKKIVAGFAGGK